jgi:hypothetical protein
MTLGYILDRKAIHYIQHWNNNSRRLEEPFIISCGRHIEEQYLPPSVKAWFDQEGYVLEELDENDNENFPPLEDAS